MAFDRLKTEISMLLTQMENQPQNLWELHEQILEKLNELRALNLPLPDPAELVELEIENSLAIWKLEDFLIRKLSFAILRHFGIWIYVGSWQQRWLDKTRH